MICPNCGKDIPNGSIFCDGCGQPVKIKNEAVRKFEYSDVHKRKISILGTFKHSIKDFYTDFTTGRASRKEFWSTFLFSVLFLLIPWSLCLILMIAMTKNADSASVVLLFIPFFFLIIPFFLFGFLFDLTLLRLMVRRAHDIGCPWGCIFIPFFNFFMLFIPGNVGPNKYGEEPEI